MLGQPSVLIVDRSEETREVLRTALERRGVKTLSASRTAGGLRLVQEHQPDLIVLDMELDDASDCLSQGIASFVSEKSLQGVESAESEGYQPRLVLLGKMRGWKERIPEGEFIAKPYHFGLLIRRIEELLAEKG